MESQIRDPKGKRLGKYRLFELIGQGGSGDVYRATTIPDGPVVALKIMRTTTPDRHELHRFQREAKSLTLLSHPNIVGVHDAGTYENTPYIATELLDGETLRDRLSRGTLPPRIAAELAIQVAEGLSAAHQHGLVHRDLKPENLFLTAGDQIKILDFGLAKLVRAAANAAQVSSTVSRTHPGTVLGTLGYMAPEQIHTEDPVDHRADIFSLGAILYEMLTGLRAFQRDTPAETVGAVLHADPPALTTVRPEVPAALQEVVRNCLAKSPAQRFDSARDVALALRAVLKGFDKTAPRGGPTPMYGGAGRRVIRNGILVTLALAVSTLSAWLAWRALRTVPDNARFARVTFARGAVMSARIAPDGRVIYEGLFNGKPAELFATVPGTAESRPLGICGAVLSISSSGELALSLNRRTVRGYLRVGSLAVGPLEGRAPRHLLDGVYWAEWKPRSTELAVVRDGGGRMRLEILGGRILYETSGWLGEPRFSPNGRFIALADHPMLANSDGSIVLLDDAAQPRILSSGWTNIVGMAWSPNGNELYVTGDRGTGPALHAVRLDGRTRLVRHGMGTIRLYDVGGDGNLLLARDDVRLEAWGTTSPDERERNLSWLDWTLPRDFSPDGSLLFSEAGEAVGTERGVYVRNLLTSEVTRLGPGSGQAFSPDGRHVLALARGELMLQPVGAGEPTSLGKNGIAHNPWAGFFPDGDRIVFAGSEPPRGSRIYAQRLPAGKPFPISPEGFGLSTASAVSRDGLTIAAIGPDERIYLCPAQGGEPRLVPGSKPGELVAGWDPTGPGLLVFKPSELPVTLYRLGLGGERRVWRTLGSQDLAGAVTVHRVVVARGGRSYAYTLERVLSDLYLGTGLL